MVGYCVVPGCSSRRPKMKLFCIPFTNKTRYDLWLEACPFLKRYRNTQLENVRICTLHFIPTHINEKNRLTVDAIPMLILYAGDRQQVCKVDDQIDPRLYLEISSNIVNNVPHNFTILHPPQINDSSQSLPTIEVIYGKKDNIRPQNDVPSEQVLSKPVHESQESIVSKEVTIFEQVQSNTVHVPQGYTGVENDTTLGQSQNIIVPQGCTAPKADNILGQLYSNTVHIPQGRIVSKTDKILEQSENNTVTQGCITSETDTILEQSQNNIVHIRQGGITLKTYSKQVQNKVKESIVPDNYSWNAQNTPVEISQDEPEHLDDDDDDDVPDNLSMYCDNGDTDTVKARYVNCTGRHEGFYCDNCKGEIVGFRYTCMQCSNLDLCVACESNSAHAHHYMLRVPSPRPYNEIQRILVRIRKHLMREWDSISAPDRDNGDAISMKSDIKSENEEELEQIDPLYENVPYYDEVKENSRLFSPGSEHSENNVAEETSQNNRPVLRRVKILKVKREINQIPLSRVPTNSESTTPPRTAKRKIVISLAEFLKVKESNHVGKNLNVRPYNGMKETNMAPKILTVKNAGAFNPVVKLSKLPQSTLLQHERAGLIQVRPLNSLQKITNTEEGIR